MWKDKDIVGILVFSLLVVVNYAKVISMPRQLRMSLAEPMPYYFNNNVDGHPGTYSFGYDVADPATGNSQFRTEERYPNGTVVGSYGYVDAWGRPHQYRYIADEKGYRVMRDPPHKPHRQPNPVNQYPSNAAQIYPSSSSKPMSYPVSESSITWIRPKRPNKIKNENYYLNRPTHNFIGPPSSYAED